MLSACINCYPGCPPLGAFRGCRQELCQGGCRDGIVWDGSGGAGARLRSAPKLLLTAVSRCVCCYRTGAEDQAAACCVPRGAPRFNKGQRPRVRAPGGFRVHPVIARLVCGGVAAQRRRPVCMRKGGSARLLRLSHVCLCGVSTRETTRRMGGVGCCWKLSVRAVAFTRGGIDRLLDSTMKDRTNWPSADCARGRSQGSLNTQIHTQGMK
eukprot:COSAG02_NODE_754_length_17578_cov_97.544825_6_plen_210_part_00